MNLLTDRWIPIRDSRNQARLIAPHELTADIGSNPILRLDAPRPDFNGALAQFLIGLVQTAWVLAGRRWNRERMLLQPPSPDELAQAFAPFTHAFELDGDGPRFMQDLTLCAADKPAENGMAALLIDSPGEQASERNTDHFVKRGQGSAMCTHCAAMALFTLMTNAPSGGAGHRTSLRGGGPLTTLLVHDPEAADAPPPALWRDVAANVRDTPRFVADANPERAELKHVFPWLAAIEALQPGAETQPLDTHPAQMYWAMPRRIRLVFDASAPGVCELCGAIDRPLVERYHTKNYGMNYKGPWRHPLSPYYRSKPADPPLPMHPQPDGLGYRHWLGWVLGLEQKGRVVEPAAVVRDLLSEQPSAQFRLWAFGYDMDNMKARCWYESRFPLFDFPPGDEAAEALRGLLDRLLETAELSASFFRWAVRDAWLGDADARGDLSFVEAGFWSTTEPAFFACVAQAAAVVRQHGRDAFEESLALREAWLSAVRREVLALFDLHAATGVVEAAHPARLAAAQRVLRSQLWGDKLRAAAGLPIEKAPAKARAKKSSTGEKV
jgi:CRISPR system Cascade subunit CasA